MSKRILTMLLAACMVLSMGTVAFATEDVACTHGKTKQVELRAPTCEKAGINKVVCEDCKETVGYVSTGLHNYEIDDIVQPYACQPGKQIWKCADCDETKEILVEATRDHVVVDGTVNATCTKPERVGEVCAICGEAQGEMQDVEGSKALGHKYEILRGEEAEAFWKNHSGWVIQGVPHALECGDAGLVVRMCTVCGEGTIITGTIDHEWVETGYVEASCDHVNGMEQECVYCGDTYVEEFTGDLADELLEHTPAKPVIEGDCQDEYRYEVIYCSVCDSELDREVAENEAGHVLKETVVREADCDTVGISKVVCTVEECGYSAYITTGVKHSWEFNDLLAQGNCGASGEIEEICTICGETREEIIPATNAHKWAEDTVVDPTCTEDGYIATVCSVCGQTKEGTEQPIDDESYNATGHKMVVDAKATKATCTKEDEIRYVCAYCGLPGAELREEIADTTKYPTFGLLEHNLDDGQLVDVNCAHATGYLFSCTNEGCDYTEFEALKGPNGQPLEEELLEHVYMTSIEDPTCQKEGKKVVECTVCGQKTEETLAIDEDAHVLDETVVRAGTCTTTGISKFVCTEKGCGHSFYAVTSYGHQYDEAETIVAANCGYEGKAIATCSVCGVEDEIVLPVVGEHNYAEGIVPADCVNPEKVGVVCTVCGKSQGALTDVAGSEALGHDLVIKETTATCDKAGDTIYVCTRCDYTATVKNEALEHVFSKEGVHVDASCDHDESMMFSCIYEGCDEAIYEPIKGGEKKLEHNFKPYEFEGDCTHVSYTCEKCTVCGYETLRNDGVYGDHVYERTTLRAATCEKNGIDKVVCMNKDCDSYGKAAYESVSKEHAWGEELYETEGDWTTIYRVCADCGEIDVLDKVYEHIHTWDEGKETKAATCTEAGEMTFTCTGVKEDGKTACGETKVEAIEAAHVEKTVPGKAATCTEAGLTDGVICAVCEEVLVAQEEIPAAHTEEIIPGVEATEESTGLTEGKKCSVCGEILVAQEEIPVVVPEVHEHDWDEGVETKAATCTEAGEITYTCACGETKTEATELADHSYVTKWAAKVDENGEYVLDEDGNFVTVATKTCSVCGDVA